MSSFIRHLVVAVFSISLGAAALQAGTAQAVSQNVKTIAGILAGLNHFANDTDKATLQGIVASDTATAPEKTLAQALSGVQHTATAADKAKLEALAKDTAAPESTKTIAGILVHLNHTASAEEKATLAKLVAAP